jgi:hypothetical protein
MNYSNFYARLYTFLGRLGVAFRRIFKFNYTKVYVGVIIFLQALVWLQTIAVFRRLTGDSAILHYNIDFGVDLIGSPQEVFYYPLFGLAVAIINISLAAIISRRHEPRLVIHFLLLAAVAFAVFLNLALLAINFINFR